MKYFYHLLANSLIAMITNNFVWFALIYWTYLSTRSVLVTSLMTGIYLVAVAVSGFWIGSLVDHMKKKDAIFVSSLGTLFFFGLSWLIFVIVPDEAFTTFYSWPLWLLISSTLLGVIAGNIRAIAIPTVTTLLVSEDERDKANGLSGTVMGISFSVASVASGFVLGFTNMGWVFMAGVGLTALAAIHIWTIPVPEKKIIHTEGDHQKLDIKGTISIIKDIPGLFALIFFTTFNNFLGGVFMPLMDPYGLSLVSLQVWGILWGFLSLGFIVGGLIIAKFGLGKKPLQRLFVINIIMWIVCIFFTIQPSIILLSIGMLIWITLMPFVEATEHTIIQKVVPVGRQGRVFGFAQTIETTASPVTAFMIGPIAQFFFIPFMTTGAGVDFIGDWFGIGPGRGIALLFMVAGVVGLIATLLAMRLPAYKVLSAKYQE